MGTERGFTCVEVLVAMVVLSVGVLGVLQATLLAARLERRSEALSSGTFLAQGRLERIGALGFERAVAGLAQAPLPPPCGLEGTYPQETVEGRAVRFLVAYQREPAPVDPPLCTVHCFWPREDGAFDRRNVVRLSLRRSR